MKKILVVDDEFEELEQIKEILQKEFEVTIATNGAQAMDYIDSNEFNLFLVDIKMPALSGYDLARLIKEKKQGSTKIIFVSIVSRKEVDLTEVDGFIQKPISSELLLNEVKSVLG